MTDSYPFDAVSAFPAADIAAAWDRELPGTPVSSIEIVTPIWRLAKLFADDRRRVLHACGVDAATLDLLSVIRRAGPPYRLSTREITARALVTAGAISQRVARAEQAGLVARSPAADGSRTVLVTLTPAGHELIGRTVDRVLSREAQLMGDLDPSQRRALAAQLDQLLADVAGRLRWPAEVRRRGPDRPIRYAPRPAYDHAPIPQPARAYLIWPRVAPTYAIHQQQRKK